MFDDVFRHDTGMNSRNIIVKKEIPKIEDVFRKRIEEGKKIEPDRYYNWSDAGKILDTLLSKLSMREEAEGNLITQLANNGIFKSLSAFGTILENKRYFHRNKGRTQGAFDVDLKEYDLRREAIYKALFLKEERSYMPKPGDPEDMLCNIVTPSRNCELLGLYIIKYLMHLLPEDSSGFKILDLYGSEDTCETGKDIVENICSVFEKKGSEDYEDLETRLTWMMNHLYKSSVLLRSIYDVEDYKKVQNLGIEKDYCEKGHFYLSLRGNALFNMLSNNSLLLEILRDDIEAKIYNSEEKSFDLSFADRITYLIEYVRMLFVEYEKSFIFSAIKNRSTDKYIEFFGGEFFSSRLLMGIKKSIIWYFNEKHPQFEENKEKFNDVKIKFNSTLEIMEDYSKRLTEAQTVKLIADPLLKKIY